MKKGILFTAVVLFAMSCNESKKVTLENTTPVLTEAELEAAYGSLYQYYHTDPKTQDQRDENLIIEYAADKGLDVKRTASGLYYQITEEGAGAKINRGESITADYRGYFSDGKVFDESYKRGKPLTFNHGQMVAGWNEGLLLLNRGSKATFLLPSRLGYGTRGFPGFVEPNKVIIFDLVLLDK